MLAPRLLRVSLGVLITAGLACSAPKVVNTPEPSPSEIATGRPAEELLLEVRSMPAGFHIAGDGPLSLDATAEAGAPADAPFRKLFLQGNRFLSAAYRLFELENGGAISRTHQVILIVFGDQASAQRAVEHWFTSYKSLRFPEASIGAGLGDLSRAVASEGTGPGPSGNVISVFEAIIVYSLGNVMVQASLQDDIGQASVLECLTFARLQHTQLKSAIGR